MAMQIAMKSKYDTNPLDEDYAKRADEAWGEPRRVEPLKGSKEEWPAEAPTKRYDSSIPMSYPSINVPPTYQAQRATPQVSSRPGLSTRAVPGLGLPEKVTLALPYAPFFIGAVAGAVELLVTPRSESRIRANAAHALVLHLFGIAISMVLSTVGSITGSGLGAKLFWTASTIFFIIATIRAWKGEPVHIPAAEDAADWLNERIHHSNSQKRR
jgi:uncharacterized membrane protein